MKTQTIFLGLVLFVLGCSCVPTVKKRPASALDDEENTNPASSSPSSGAREKHEWKKVGGGKKGSVYSQGAGDSKLSRLLWYLDKDQHTAITANVDINLVEVHSSYRGEGQIVIVSDNRVDLDHPDLQGNANVNKSKDYTAGTDNSAWLGKMPRNTKTDSGHGTFVAGQIAMVKDNSMGMFGVAPNVELRGYNYVGSDQKVIKLIDNLGHGVEGNVTFNYSYGNFQSSFSSFSLYAESYLQYFSEKRPKVNIVWAKASGNWYLQSSDKGIIDWKGKKWFLGNANFDQMNVYPYIIIVGALNPEGKRASFSSPGSNLWVSAPGQSMSSSDIVGCSHGYSTSSRRSGPSDKQGNNLNPNCDYAAGIQGTSVSAPLVAGVVALMREVCPDTCTWREIKHALAKTAVKVDSRAGDKSQHPISSLSLQGHTYQIGWRTNSAGFSFHNHYGFGMPDVKAAIDYLENEAVVMGEFFNSLGADGGPYYKSGSLDQNIPDHDAGGTSHSMTVDAHNLTIEHVLVEVNITHPVASDLGIELTSPSGTVSQLTNINSGINQVDLDHVYLGSNAFYGENSLGTWKLKVIDGNSGETGVLKNWGLKIMGHQDPFSVGTGPAGIVNASLDSSNNLSWELPAGASNLRRVEVCILDKELQCSTHDWMSFPPTPSEFEVSHYKSYSKHGLWVPINPGIKKVKIRVVDDSENTSSISSYDFDFQ